MKIDQVSSQWAKEWRAEYIDAATEKLINLTTYDLYFGPLMADDCEAPPIDEFGNENEWSGYNFVSACSKIRQALSNLPSQLFVDVDAEFWTENEPQIETCNSPRCSFGKDDKEEVCDFCDGKGYIEPFWENWTKLEHKQLKQLIVSKELADYV